MVLEMNKTGIKMLKAQGNTNYLEIKMFAVTPNVLLKDERFRRISFSLTTHDPDS